jgi:hypothetical protein
VTDGCGYADGCCCGCNDILGHIDNNATLDDLDVSIMSHWLKLTLIHLVIGPAVGIVGMGITLVL